MLSVPLSRGRVRPEPALGTQVVVFDWHFAALVMAVEKWPENFFWLLAPLVQGRGL
jgi:hypothetical protein